MNEDARNTLVKSIETKQKSLQRQAEDAQNEFQQQQNEIAQRILQKMAPVIDKYAKANGYSLLLDSSNPWPQGPLLWATQSVDLTKTIVDAYNAQSGVAAPARRSRQARPPASQRGPPHRRRQERRRSTHPSQRLPTPSRISTVADRSRAAQMGGPFRLLVASDAGQIGSLTDFISSYLSSRQLLNSLSWSYRVSSLQPCGKRLWKAAAGDVGAQLLSATQRFCPHSDADLSGRRIKGLADM